MSVFRPLVEASTARALEAIEIQEAARVTRVREVLFGILGTHLPDLDIDVILAASSQADSIRSVADIAGNNIMGEVLGRIADSLDGSR